ncbi:hypothetical protein GON26_09070 [Flavobacterium sp. GA093]|uniref:Uncharacterized protein n=1 Tax=Flavobacterium hydrocarbonoxydans TaxID=2683249 RepID=A0A6I4NU08_9FLAO|nr:hypothetical protein [Flavobacterium hydrocarbonoxydans]MWB94514.1 hypothetical protein [Flavobacterium hydrocarbonoxydans]
MDCDNSKTIDSKQRLAGFSLWRKSDFTIKFLDEWLNFAQDERILMDEVNQLGFPNYEDFIEHRHDQSIFSLLTKKYDLKAYRDPSQFGNKFCELYSMSNYPQILVSTRQRNISLYKLLKKVIKAYLKKINYILDNIVNIVMKK